MKTEHTQTPFGYTLPVSFKPNASFQDESGKFCFRISYADGKTFCIARTNSAALIVRAVNSFEPMKEALELCRFNLLQENYDVNGPVIVLLDAALKLAKGE